MTTQLRAKPTEAAPVDCTARARYFDSTTAFNIPHPDVPCHIFVDERTAALDPATGTGLIPLDLSGLLELDFAATTPLVLTRYARIRAGETLETNFRRAARPIT